MLEYERHALVLREQLAAEDPQSAVLQLELAQSCTNVGIAEPNEPGRALLCHRKCAKHRFFVPHGFLSQPRPRSLLCELIGISSTFSSPAHSC